MASKCGAAYQSVPREKSRYSFSRKKHSISISSLITEFIFFLFTTCDNNFQWKKSNHNDFVWQNHMLNSKWKIKKKSQFDLNHWSLVVGWLGWSENWPSPTIGSFYAYPSKIDFHTKFRQNRMKIVEVSQSHVVGTGVGWLGCLGWSDFRYRLISQADCQDKAPYKISTQYDLGKKKRTKISQNWFQV